MVRAQKVSEAPRKVILSKRVIDALRCPEDCRWVYLLDAKVHGLMICRTRAGSASWYLYRRVNGRPARIRLGGYPEFTPEQARRRAAEVNRDIAAGLNPQALKRARRQEITLGELFGVYLEQHLKPKRREKTWREAEAMFNRHLARLKNRPVSSIDATELQALHARIGRKAKYAANRVLELLHSTFKLGVKLRHLPENPASGIESFPEAKRDRFILPDEFPAFWAALEAPETNETIRDFIKLALFTGARRRLVQAMRWDEIDFTRAVWAIAAASAGSKGAGYLVSLSPLAMEVLQARRQNATGEWVLPGRGKSGHLEEVKTTWADLLKRAKLKDLRIHDLRRTLGSWQAIGGASLPVIGGSLGHRDMSATQIYARLTMDPIRLSVNQATQAMVEAAQMRPCLPSPTQSEGAA